MDERMDAPNGKRIVELLRKAAMGGYEGSKNKVMDDLAQLIGCYGGMHFHTIGKLADMVEEAIQREHESAYDAGYDAGYDEGFASADDWCAQHEDAMAEHGWVKLPVDADGKVVRIGDVMVMASHPFGCEDKPLVVDRMELSRGMHGEVWCLALDTDRSCWTQAAVLRHHKQPTVEDVLREMLDKWGEMPSNMTNEAIVAEYAAKLQLRGDE